MTFTKSNKQDSLAPPPNVSSANLSGRQRVSPESVVGKPRPSPVASNRHHESHSECEMFVSPVAAPDTAKAQRETSQATSTSKESRQAQEKNEIPQETLNNRMNSDPTSSSSRADPPRQDSDNWTETDALVPRRNLTELDVAALILNKMVGTGIFTMPGTVLANTKSKSVSMVLWAVGGVWTVMFLLVYLEFGSAFPFNGGELIYLDEIYYRPELLATILFSGWFLILGNSYGNTIAFAKHVLISADPKAVGSADLDSRLVRFVAIAVLTVVCLLHYFSGRAGIFLNKVLFWYKTLLLVVVFAAGVHYANTHGSQWNNYNDESETGTSVDGLAAMVSIFYAYQGWENANYVTGEIRALEGRTPARTLKIGAFIAVILVWILYILVTLAYYLVLDFKSITDTHSDLGLVLHFAPKVFGSARGLKVCIALSAFGNIVAVTYTSSKVKQSIAYQRIIPFWRFFSKDSDTPKGALALHWVSSVILICICPTTSDGYSFATGLFTYGHLIFSIFVTMGLFWLEKRVREIWPDYTLSWYFRSKVKISVLAVVFFGGNVLVLVQSAIKHDPGKIPRYWWLVTTVIIIGGSFTYWAAMMLMTVRVGKEEKKPETIGSKLGFEVLIYKADEESPEALSEDMLESMRLSRQDGSKRRVGYKFSGVFARCGNGFTRVQNFLAKYMF